MAEDMGDKTEAPTARRRTEAREQGNIARSHDLTAAVLLLAFLYLIQWFGTGVVRSLRTLIVELLGPKSLSETDTNGLASSLSALLFPVLMALLPLLAGAMIVGILINMFQVGFYFNPARLTPNLGALNPLKGLGKLFRGPGWVQMGMNVLKMVLMGIVSYSAITSRMPQIIAAQELTFTQGFALASQIVFSVALRIGVVLLILAIIDYVYQRFRIERELRMTKQEVKDEMRSMDGDPRVKSRRRQIAMQIAQGRIRKDVPTADVVVTNPTEFAVALKYDPARMNAPRVVAKGRGYLAQRIRQIAVEHGVPILERKPLARALYRLVEVGQEIPEQYYSAVAEILAYVYELTGKTRRQKAAV
jgi:flagellar biosynthesis protein FlhB